MAAARRKKNIVSSDNDDDDDVVEVPAPATAASRPRRSAAATPSRSVSSTSLAPINSSTSTSKTQQVEISVEIPSRSKGKGKAKATSDDELEHAIERGSTKNRAQIEADALLAAQLAVDDDDQEEAIDDLTASDFEQEDEEEEDEEDDSGDDFEDEQPPSRKRARTSAASSSAKPRKSDASTKSNKRATPVKNGSTKKATKSASKSSSIARQTVDDGSDDDDDSDFSGSLSDLDDLDDAEPLASRYGSKAAATGRKAAGKNKPTAGSVPAGFVFKKRDNSNYIRTPQNAGKMLPYVIKEYAEKARKERAEAEAVAAAAAAAAAAQEAETAEKETATRPSSSRTSSRRSAPASTSKDKSDTSEKEKPNGKPAKGSMQEEQRYETAKQREARIKREERLARSMEIAAAAGVKRKTVSHYERNKAKLEAHHPELTTVWKDLADVPLPPPRIAEPPKNIAKGVTLLPFQLESLHWLIDQEESHWQGGLLADEMGMGKTVQMISLMLSDEERRSKTDKARSTLVVAPTVALMQWANELQKYAPQFKVLLWHGANRAAASESDTLRKADVVLTSYAVLESSFRRQESGFVRKGEKFKEKSAVHSIDWRRVILDEAHCIKDRSTNTAKGAFALRAMYRWCLSGTPLQNRVGELFSMVRFIGAEPFANYYCLQCDCKSMHWTMVQGKFCEACGHTPMHHTCFWNNEVLKPIQRHGAEEGEGKDAFVRLRTLLQHMMLRRTKLERADDMGLPPRTMLVRRDVFNEEEADLYQSLYSDGQRKFTTFIDSGTVLNNYSNIFTLLTRMRQMACHPDLVLRSKTGSAAKILGDSVSETHVCKLCADEAEDPIMSACRHVFCRGCISEYVGDTEAAGGIRLECPYCHANLAIDLEQETMDAPRPEQNARQGLLSRLDLSKWRSSTKVEALVEELTSLRSEDHTIKSIVFSQFRSFLDLIAFRLSRAGFKVARLEGDMTPQQRDGTIKYFSENTSVTVFLISLKAGGVALNLTEASRVYLMDPWWNPSVELQAADRIHRIGQHRPIIVKRMIIENSIEARIVELQNKKSAMIEAAIGKDDSAMGRLSVADLQFLFQ
ncbi:hypothetical protein A4X09_0g6221 [Tilletia walkeri]|uniref:DNA repair protein RAD16 n=1 Tax=Tilletia walkeri TaxID=117179 RepID=A0A8X7T244_9BASI|nr:hypothetical protein A4X09_0g6221 [Tilletia walkeri]